MSDNEDFSGGSIHSNGLEPDSERLVCQGIPAGNDNAGLPDTNESDGFLSYPRRERADTLYVLPAETTFGKFGRFALFGIFLLACAATFLFWSGITDFMNIDYAASGQIAFGLCVGAGICLAIAAWIRPSPKQNSLDVTLEKSSKLANFFAILLFLACTTALILLTGGIEGASMPALTAAISGAGVLAASLCIGGLGLCLLIPVGFILKSSLFGGHNDDFSSQEHGDEDTPYCCWPPFCQQPSNASNPIITKAARPIDGYMVHEDDQGQKLTS